MAFAVGFVLCHGFAAGLNAIQMIKNIGSIRSFFCRLSYIYFNKTKLLFDSFIAAKLLLLSKLPFYYLLTKCFLPEIIHYGNWCLNVADPHD